MQRLADAHNSLLVWIFLTGINAAAIDWPCSGKSQYKGLLTGYTHEGIKSVESCKKLLVMKNILPQTSQWSVVSKKKFWKLITDHWSMTTATFKVRPVPAGLFVPGRSV
jgi:hypothetical protein